MAAMEGVVGGHHDQSQQLQQQEGLAAPPPKVVERLNQAVQQQLNLDSVKTRAISLFKAISRILDEIDLLARTNAVPKWYECGFVLFSSCVLCRWILDVFNCTKLFATSHSTTIACSHFELLRYSVSCLLLPLFVLETTFVPYLSCFHYVSVTLPLQMYECTLPKCTQDPNLRLRSQRNGSSTSYSSPQSSQMSFYGSVDQSQCNTRRIIELQFLVCTVSYLQENKKSLL